MQWRLTLSESLLHVARPRYSRSVYNWKSKTSTLQGGPSHVCVHILEINNQWCDEFKHIIKLRWSKTTPSETVRSTCLSIMRVTSQRFFSLLGNNLTVAMKYSNSSLACFRTSLHPPSQKRRVVGLTTFVTTFLWVQWASLLLSTSLLTCSSSWTVVWPCSAAANASLDLAGAFWGRLRCWWAWRTSYPLVSYI